MRKYLGLGGIETMGLLLLGSTRPRTCRFDIFGFAHGTWSLCSHKIEEIKGLCGVGF